MQELEIFTKSFGTPTDSQLEKINNLSRKHLEKEDVFVFSAKLCGDMIIPGRFIQLSKPVLNQFKKDAQSGVAYLLDHPWAGIFARPKAAIPYGRTFDAQLKKSDVEDETIALYADHYVVRGKEIDGISTDSIISNIEDGTFQDTSIGWGSDGKYECSICGNDIRDWQACSHLPGEEYDKKLCYAIAEMPASLFENSSVFCGAYPTAGVMSQVGTEGEEKSEWVMVDNLKDTPVGCQLFHIFSASKGALFTFAKKDSLKGGDTVAKEKKDEKLEIGATSTVEEKKEYTQAEIDALVQEKVDAFKAELEANTAPVVVFMDATQATEALGKEYTADEVLAFAKKGLSPVTQEIDPEVLKSLAFITAEKATEFFGEEIPADTVLQRAKEGIAYRKELIDETVSEGVRAQGESFAADTWRESFAEMEIPQIKEFAATFHMFAEKVIPAGRLSSPVAKREGEKDLPDEAFKTGRGYK